MESRCCSLKNRTPLSKSLPALSTKITFGPLIMISEIFGERSRGEIGPNPTSSSISAWRNRSIGIFAGISWRRSFRVRSKQVSSFARMSDLSISFIALSDRLSFSRMFSWMDLVSAMVSGSYRTVAFANSRLKSVVASCFCRTSG